MAGLDLVKPPGSTALPSRAFFRTGHEWGSIRLRLAAFLRTGPRMHRDADHESGVPCRRYPQPMSEQSTALWWCRTDGWILRRLTNMTTASRQIVLTRAKARALGIPLSDLLGPDFTRLFHDTYVCSGQIITLRVRARTIMKRLPAATHVSHHTAVRLWGGVAPDSADIHVSMASREARCRRAGVSAHLGNPAAETTIWDGVHVSTPVPAFLDLASVGVTLVDLVIAGDTLTKANELDPKEFVAAAEAYQGRNARRARRAASLVRAGVDSPMETRVRLLIVLAGLPEPQVNVIVRIAGGKWRWRFDLCYPEYKLIIEYDGRQHAYDAEQWSHDLERREWLDQDGWRIIVVISDGVYVHPLRTLQRVKAALEERGLAFRSLLSRSGRDISPAACR